MKVSVPWFEPPYPNGRYIFTIPIGCYDAVANSNTGRKASNLIFDKLNMIPGKYTVYINKMCILNELDFLLKNKLFFKLQTEKSVSFFIAEVRPCTTWPRKICQKNHFIQNTLQLPLDILAQKFEILIQKYLSFCSDFLTSRAALFCLGEGGGLACLYM